MRVRIHAIMIICLGLAAVVVGCAAKKQAVDSLTAQLQPEPRKEIHPEAYHHFTNAVIMEQEGDFAKAVEQYELALSFDPLSYDIRLALGTLYLNLSRPASAIDAFLPIPDKTAEIYQLLGEAFRAQGQDVDAEEAYRRAWSTDSTNINTNYQLGVYAVRDNRIDEAAKYFRVAAQVSGNWELFAQIAEMYANFEEYDSAAVFIEHAIRLNQNDPSLFARHAVYLYSSDRKSESKEVLQRAIAVHPNDARLLAQLIETYNAENNLDSVKVFAERMIAIGEVTAADRIVYERIGAVLMRARLREQASGIFQKMLKFEPENRFALFYLGRIEVDSSRYDAAKSYFDRLIAADSTVPDGWTNLAYVYQQKKDLDKAEDILETASRYVTSDRDNIQFFLAQILSQKNQSDSAIAVLKNAINDGGDTIRALFQVGAEYEKLKDVPKAVETFELLLSISPDHHPTLNYLGYMLAERGERLPEALEMIERALKSEPQNGAYLDSYAWVLYKLGRYQDALLQIQKAVTATNNDPVVIEHLGDIQFALGNRENARDAWQTALAFDPQNKSLKEKLAR